MPTVPPEKALLLLKELNRQWRIVDGGKKLERKFKFKNFKEALKFVNEVGRIAEEEQHHPNIYFSWGYATITLWTHAIGGLHDNDFILAAKIDQLEPGF